MTCGLVSVTVELAWCDLPLVCACFREDDEGSTRNLRVDNLDSSSPCRRYCRRRLHAPHIPVGGVQEAPRVNVFSSSSFPPRAPLARRCKSLVPWSSAAPRRAKTFNPVIQLHHAGPCTGSRTQVFLLSFCYPSVVNASVKGSDVTKRAGGFASRRLSLCRTALFLRSSRA